MAGAFSCVGHLSNVVFVQLITDLIQNFFKGNLAKQRGIVDDLILLIELHVFLFHLHHQLLILMTMRRKVNAKNCIRLRD